MAGTCHCGLSVLLAHASLTGAEQAYPFYDVPMHFPRGQLHDRVWHVNAFESGASAMEIAAVIAQNGPIAVRQAKKAIAWGSETDIDTGMRLAIEAYNITVNTDDRLEGVRAFNEKRPPQFQGR